MTSGLGANKSCEFVVIDESGDGYFTIINGDLHIIRNISFNFLEGVIQRSGTKIIPLKCKRYIVVNLFEKLWLLGMGMLVIYGSYTLWKK